MERLKYEEITMEGKRWFEITFSLDTKESEKHSLGAGMKSKNVWKVGIWVYTITSMTKINILKIMMVLSSLIWSTI